MRRQIVALIQHWGGSGQRKDQNNARNCVVYKLCLEPGKNAATKDGTQGEKRSQDLEVSMEKIK